VTFGKDGKLATGGADRHATVWAGSDATWKIKAAAEAKEGALHSVALAMDNSTLAVGTEMGVIRVWDIVKGKPLAVLKEHAGSVWAVAFSNDGKLLAGGAGAVDKAGEVRLWNTHDGKLTATLPLPSRVLCVAFTNDNQTLAASGADGTVSLFDLAKVK
jgi:WD40 repeat protein